MFVKKGDKVKVITGKDKKRENNFMKIVSLAPEVL